MFSGLRSRWTMPFLWLASRAEQHCAMTCKVSSKDMPVRASRAESPSPSRYSMMK